MATIVVEDGSEVTGANSYISEAGLTTYATDRGVTISGTTAVLLIQAMDYLEQQLFQGEKVTDTQALQWPRNGVWIDGYSVDNDEIPQLLKDTLCEIALGIDAGNNPLATVERQTSKETVGPISVEYEKGTYELPHLTAVENKLKKLLYRGSNGINAAVYRA